MFSILVRLLTLLLFFFFNDTATTEIYTLSLHDALPITSLTVPIICIASPATLGVALPLPRRNGNATVGRYGDPWYRPVVQWDRARCRTRDGRNFGTSASPAPARAARHPPDCGAGARARSTGCRRRGRPGARAHGPPQSTPVPRAPGIP